MIEIRGDPSKSVSYKLQTTVLYEMSVLDEKTQQLTEIYGSTKKNVRLISFREYSRNAGALSMK